MRAVGGCRKPERVTLKALIISYITLLIASASKSVLAFASLSTGRSAKTSVDRGAHKLWGKARIQRVGLRIDNDESKRRNLIEEGKEQNDEIELPSMSLEELLQPSSKCDVNQVGPTALAYIGDVVFELMVRARHVWPTRRTSDLQRQVVALVRGMWRSVVTSQSTIFYLTCF
jgi:hypothetical protein